MRITEKRAMMIALLMSSACGSTAWAYEQQGPVDAEASVDKAGATSPTAAERGASSASETPAAKEPSVTRRKPARRASADSSEITITGSRLQNGDSTSVTTVITQEDIRKRGVTSVEELIRTLPQNMATIGAVTNERTRGPLADRRGAVSQLGSLGVSAANLGGMGAGNTLILINGRRVAGAAGIEDGFANLNGIPLNAVDRVEINTGGASAVYGADAMGGVINFILKKNYVGTTVNAQYENSNNGADVKRVSAYSGYAWGSGSISGTASYRWNDPANNAKTGYVTQDYSDYYDDERWNRRSFSQGLQPGVISRPTYVYDPVTGIPSTIDRGLTVPVGFTGRPGINDFITVGSEAKRGYIPEYAGPKTNALSFSYDFEQKITDRLKITSSGLFSRSKNSQIASPSTGLVIPLAPGQYYNPFPAYYFDSWAPGITSYYYPGDEIASGELPSGVIKGTAKQWTVNAGLSYRFGKDHLFEAIYTRSGSSTHNVSDNFSSIVSINADPTNRNRGVCYQLNIASPQYYRGSDYAAYQAVYNRQCQALTSTDPNLAFNPWKSSANGGGSSIRDFYWRDDQEQRNSTLENYEARMRGTLVTLPAGPVAYAVGGEYNTDGVNSREVNVFTGTAVSRSRYAFFGELSVPIVGRDFTLPAIYRLTADLAVRRDTYNTEGAIGTVNNIALDRGGQLIFGKNSFSRSTPAFGLRWEPTSSIVLRARWSRGFRAPPYTQLFNVNGTRTFATTILNDPQYQCTTDCTVRYGNVRGYSVPRTTSPNPDLRPQTSKQQQFNASWHPQGFLRGLSLDVTYNRTRIFNEYADMDDLVQYLPAGQQMSLPLFYPRDSNGKITAVNNTTFNLSMSEYSSIFYELGYQFNTSFGAFEPRVSYLNNLKAERKAFPNSNPISTIGTLQGADRYKIQGSLSWYMGDWSAALWGYYTPSYTNNYIVDTYLGVIANPQLNRPVRSYTTFDLTATWKASDRLRMNFASRNITDAKPPFVVVETRPYDTSRYNIAGRTISLELQYSF